MSTALQLCMISAPASLLHSGHILHVPPTLVLALGKQHCVEGH